LREFCHAGRQLSGGEVFRHHTMIHQIEAVRDLGGKTEVLLDQKYRHASLLQLHQHIADALDDDRRQPLSRLI